MTHETPAPDGVLPFAGRPALPAEARPRLLVVVDTEEEFDWTAPFARGSTAVTAMRQIGRAQQIFDRYRLVPTYVIDYPVASQAEGYRPLAEIAADRRATIGAHLHPWVNPPHVEAVSRPNSFLMNLPEPLQRDKLRVLADEITERFGTAPVIFKAGRYGLGPATVRILEELGFTVDMSVCPRLDSSDEGGPSFAGFDAAPFLLTPALLEIPCTVDYVGWSGALRPALHRFASRPWMVRWRSLGLLARAGVVNQVMLSPEGNRFEEMRDLARSLVARGLRVFTLSFHSPSVEPGHTPYVRSQGDLATFLGSIDRFCEFFMAELGGRPATPLEFRDEVLSLRGTGI